MIEDYALDMKADTLRKAGVGIKLANDAGMIGAEGYVERQKMRDLINENNKVYRATARDDLLREAIASAISKLPANQAAFRQTGVIRDLSGGELVLAIGDIHFGEIMDVKGFLGETINHYDEDVCQNRFGQILDRVCEIVRRENVSNINVMVVGDMISGMLRMSQLQNLRYGIVDSTIKFSDMFTQWLCELRDRTQLHIDVHMVGGNHDEVRPLGSKAGDFPKDNMCKIIHHYLCAKFDSPAHGVTIHDLTGKYHHANIEGYDFLMLHGDGGKIQDLCRDSVNIYGKQIDFFVCGHLHHEEELATGVTQNGNSMMIRVGSICGADGFALKLGRFSRPSATAMVIQKGYGRRCVYPIELS